jgi:hypothetical protein
MWIHRSSNKMPALERTVKQPFVVFGRVIASLWVASMQY